MKRAQPRSLEIVTADALEAYLGKRKLAEKEPPFELLVRGNPRASFPSPEMSSIEADEELES